MIIMDMAPPSLGDTAEADRRKTAGHAARMAQSDACVHELFEQQAARTPDAVAVVFGKHQLGYGQLNERANRVAHYLSRRGVGREALVGVCLERTPDMLAALLGVWK